MYCYAQFLPNWSLNARSAAWGEAVQVKSNAPHLLAKTLGGLKAEARQRLRIFMSSTTDPYQPIERKEQITRRCLEVFAGFSDLDLLVIQTRSPLVERDLDLLSTIPYAWLSMTIETNDQSYLHSMKGGPLLAKRWQVVREASTRGIPTQITVSPCLPFPSLKTFSEELLSSGARRVVVDTVVDGDGSGGKRTANTPFAQTNPCWSDTSAAHQLYDYLFSHAQEIEIGWSNEGFCGIPPRYSTPPMFKASVSRA